MQTINHFLGVMLVLSIVVLPATPVFAETGQAGTAGELTLADFQRMYAGQKAIVAQSEYERYRYRLKHPAPQPTLDVSRMRAEESEKTFADFQRMYAGQKAIVAQSEYERYQYGLKHPSTGKVVEAVAYISPAYRLKPWLNGAPRKGKN